MGHDVLAWGRLKPAPANAYNEHVWPRYDATKYVRCWLSSLDRYADGLHRGVYSFDTRAHFYAGSHRRYVRWRELLAKLAGYPAAQVLPEAFLDRRRAQSWLSAAEINMLYGAPRTTPSHEIGAIAAGGGPFWELLDAGYDATIGEKTSQKLLADFAKFDEAAANVANTDEAFAEFYDSQPNWISYCSFRKAFAVAADGGFLNTG
jgi:hypothetical protein